jgi:hypothetical protein
MVFSQEPAALKLKWTGYKFILIFWEDKDQLFDISMLVSVLIWTFLIVLAT